MTGFLKICICIVMLISFYACATYRQASDESGLETDEFSVMEPVETFDAVHDLDDLMVYLRHRGFIYENEMMIAGLEQGYLEGRKFTSNGIDYTVYRINESYPEIQDIVSEARKTNIMNLQMGREFVKNPVFVIRNFLVFYPEDADISVLRSYFP